MRGWQAAGALALGLVLLAGCSDPVGPLGNGAPQGRVCGPGVKGQTDTFGYILGNTGSSPVTLQGVTLDPGHGLSITRAYVIPIINKRAIGTLASWPPRASMWAAWSQRQAVPGAVIGPGATVNLVFGLTLTKTVWGRANGPVITYTSAGNSYSVSEQIGVQMGHSGCSI
jgi:hypothetical protein